MRLDIGSKPDKDARVVSVEGSVDIDSAPSLRSALSSIAQEDCCLVVVDLRAVTFIDSAGVAALVGAVREVQAAGAQLRLACDEKKIAGEFHIYGLDRVVPMFSTVHEALAG
jgi:anti-sigma B factor antagonist